MAKCSQARRVVLLTLRIRPAGHRHEERCGQQRSGEERQQQAGTNCSTPHMKALLAAVEQVDAEPAVAAPATAAAATEDSMAAGAVSSSPALAARAAQVAQRRLEQALQAFEEADAGSPEGMLRPLRLLALVGHGGRLLQVPPSGWG